jgi:Flp pilus assembly protein TadG
MRLHRKPRRAAAAVEFAVVAPLAFLLLIGLIISVMGVFRFQQMAHLAREASRWASVHGSQYAKETGKPAATAVDVYNQVIAPNATALDFSKLTYSVTWNSDNSPSHTTIVNGKVVAVTNTVTVTVTYVWNPEAFFSPVTLTSTSVSPMYY